jgi:hypothetical protein
MGIAIMRSHSLGDRNWLLDFKFDEISLRYLDELVKITGYPIKSLKEALLTGIQPQVSRL